MPKVYRVHMNSGDKTEVDMSKHGIYPDYVNMKQLAEMINDWNYRSALQAKISILSDRWLYYWG